ncbi:MAG: signal peptidase II [Firmicutes bacterium]|nr:signal peptidase II [Bacillota bacterium]
MYYYLIIAAIIAADQVVKKMVVDSMELNETIPLINEVFHITYIRNTGAAFSLMDGFRGLLILLPVILIAAAMVYIHMKRKKAHPVILLSLSFIAGGGLGNVIDRAMRSFVVDYLDFRVFPVFNIADIFVCLGCGLLIIYILFLDGKTAKEKKHGNGKGNGLSSNNQ